MSKYNGDKNDVTLAKIAQKKLNNEKLAMVTCYDSSFAILVDKSPVDIVLVGDSLGNVMLGLSDTTKVTMEHMIHHTKCVSAVLTKPFLCADMPFMSYQISVSQGVENAARLVQEGGAQAVKLEGGAAIVPQVKAITEAGIPVFGHLGLTPQSIHSMSGYKVQGRGAEAETKMIEDAQALERAGASVIILELIPAPLAARVTESISIPTIGIGAGSDTDGQVLVLQDLLGFDHDFTPKFLKRYANIESVVTEALNSYVSDVKSSSFPAGEHSFTK